MKIVHSAINQVEKPKTVKLSKDKRAIQAGVIAYKIKMNRKLELKQANQS